jgi:hypothetical protein
LIAAGAAWFQSQSRKLMNPVTDRLDHARIAAGLNLKSGSTRINKKKFVY